MHTTVTPHQAASARALYRTIWRWHFYAGIFCIPFVILLAITGAIYLFKPYYESWQEAQYHGLSATREALLPNQQIAAALAAVPNGKLLSYRLPQTADEAVLVNVHADQAWQVFVNPYTGEVLGKQASSDQLMNIVKTIHGELLLGNTGSILVELAACWAIVLIVTGLYLWWPRNSAGFAGVIYPRWRQGSRVFWRDLHAVTGVWIAALALFLLVTGLPWALVWGSALKELRAFELNPVQQDWTQNRQQEHQHWRAQASDVFDLTPAILARAQALQLAPPVELSVANAHHQTWKASSQSQNRPRRADVWIQRDGSIEKHSGFADKTLLDRAIGIGIAAHEGYLFGWFNVLLGVFTCAGLVLISVSGFILWRKRKPDAVLGAPPARPAKTGTVIVGITLVLAVLLPLMGISLLVLLLLEFLVLRRIAAVRTWLGLPGAQDVA
ncbi:PepSY-associated TM helix domain-containing protein [Cellvibrio japonicus]|uniref:PepSY-associated TM helix family n=1 Tax=Cellvibrio japonicus (strain Ueda107) TaxID=498211 RepID=B3PED0_CELJU|nr:PepSY domain-containing protein [Cellvibrio japonicus]ACE84073.1 PepSY-associated TM helix family [Cellvibrio japonicus Ueda107]QEI13507.1 PepSY domain-containing protein [Cellvibrio japonicus]QEI17081.1 PepSY domain-containing protein [Cellvibrio japonicus]QEI20659.1 PepSY domain-containing protein [Cellvibrio japonicus]